MQKSKKNKTGDNIQLTVGSMQSQKKYIIIVRIDFYYHNTIIKQTEDCELKTATNEIQ